MSVLSFRGALEESLAAFLAETGTAALAPAAALAELVVGLSGHREEGRPLAPAVFLCDDAEALRQALGGTALVPVGQGPVAPATVRAALKLLAPLTTSGWSLVFRLEGAAWRLALLRTDDSALVDTPAARFRQLTQRLTALCVVQLTAQVVSVRAAGHEPRDIYLSGAPVAEAPTKLVERLRPVLVRDLKAGPHLTDALWTFYRRVLLEALRQPHGWLLAVVQAGAPLPGALGDAALLEAPLDVAGLVARAKEREARVTLEGVAGLLQGMLASDGVTVVASDGAVLGFNAFLGTGGQGRVLGGARSRAWLALKGLVGQGVVGAMTRSQDGEAEVAVAPAAE